MHAWLIVLINFLRGVRNPQKAPDDVTDEDRREMLLEAGTPEPEEVIVDEDADTPPIETLEEDPAPAGLSIRDRVSKLLEEEEWEPPVEDLPKTKRELKKVFGDPGPSKKSKEHKKFQRKWLSVAEDLPGTWNKGKPRLYVHKLFEPYLRMALWLTEMILGHVPAKKIGAYNFRRIRHSKTAPLSDHAWASAADIDSDQNRGVYRFSQWQKKKNGKWGSCPPDEAKRGPVTLPYDKTWLETWPDGMPFEMVYCFWRVGLTWGGSWSFPDREWIYFVEKYGVGYDPHRLPQEEKVQYGRAMKKWQKVSYVDPMHWECRDR